MKDVAMSARTAKKRTLKTAVRMRWQADGRPVRRQVSLNNSNRRGRQDTRTARRAEGAVAAGSAVVDAAVLEERVLEAARALAGADE